MTQKLERLEFKKTPDQELAVKMMGSNAKHIMLYGGSRSGKTVIIIRQIIIRALKRKSRHIILRAVFSHVKTSVWYDTLPWVMEHCFNGLEYYTNKSDWYIKLPNESEIWIGGLDDKERTEKILGNQYSTIFYNESSQMSYASVTLAYSRLAEKSGLVTKFFYDCNPPPKTHWTYKIFKLFVNPIASKDDPNKNLDKSMYASMMLHPEGNRENLADGYIDDVLKRLDSESRKRFYDGDFGEISNRTIMKNWYVGGNIEWHDGEPFIDGQHLKRIPSGMDFGFFPDPTTVTDRYLLGEDTLVWDSVIYENNLVPIKTDNPLQITIQQRLEEANFDKDWIIIADSSRSDSINAIRSNGYNIFAVAKPRIQDSLSILLSFNHIITERSTQIVMEFENYSRVVDKNGEIQATPKDEWNHSIDEGRYTMAMRGRLW